MVATGRVGTLVEIAAKFAKLNAERGVGNYRGNHRFGAGLVDIVLRGNQAEIALIKNRQHVIDRERLNLPMSIECNKKTEAIGFKKTFS